MTWTHTPEAKAKISAALKGRKYQKISAEARAERRLARLRTIQNPPFGLYIAPLDRRKPADGQ